MAELAAPPFDFTFSWERRADAPCSLIKGASVAHGDVSYFSPYDSSEVFSYNCAKDEWQQLPPLPQDQRNFRLTIIKGNLTTIGGDIEGEQVGFVKPERSLTGRFLTYSGNEWKENLVPAVPTPRVFPSVVQVDKYLIVAGGQSRKSAFLTVEVLDLETMRWHKAADLLEHLNEMSATVCGGRLYLAGGLGPRGATRSVYSCEVTMLLRSCGLQQGEEFEPTTTEVWSKETDVLPWHRSTLITLNDQLLAVGGVDSHNNPTDEIFIYYQKNWVLVGGLRTTTRNEFLLTVVDNKLIVVGGFSTASRLLKPKCATVEVANVELSVKYSDLECGEKLGESGLGATHKGLWKRKRMAVAIKVVACKLDPGETLRLAALRHQNVAQFYGISRRDADICYLTEFADNGSIHDYINVKGHKPEFDQSVLWAQQIAEGMSYLHQQKVVHRDLKPSNVLLTAELNAKICDFSFAQLLEHAAVKSLTGTYRWMAPEIMQQEPATLRCDVFSYGMVLWELLNHKQPFSELPAEDVRGEVLQRKRPFIPRPAPYSKRYVYKLMQICWKEDHNGRPGFEMILTALKNKGGLVLKIDNSDLEIGRTLGEGGFGEVRKGMWKSRKVEVAVKTVLTKSKFEDEVEVISVLDHPNIIQFYGAVLTPSYRIVTELAKRSLFDYLHKRKEHPSREQSLHWAEQIAEGMRYLHEHELVHRDLKSSNVLLTTEMHAKICDFGCAKFLENTAAQRFTVTGTYKWMAPEILRDEPASFSCDAFSYGMVLWELLEHKQPFEDDNAVVAASKTITGQRPPISELCEPYLVSLLKKCWEGNPEARPTFDVILSSLQNQESVL